MGIWTLFQITLTSSAVSSDTELVGGSERCPPTLPNSHPPAFSHERVYCHTVLVSSEQRQSACLLDEYIHSAVRKLRIMHIRLHHPISATFRVRCQLCRNTDSHAEQRDEDMMTHLGHSERRLSCHHIFLLGQIWQNS